MAGGGDGGVLSPLSERGGMAALIVSPGLLFLAGMVSYARRYIVRIEPQGADLILTSNGIFGGRTERVPVNQLENVRFIDPAVDAGSDRRTPALLLRPAGRWLPLIVDMKAERVD